ncbi:hypothetical protein LJ707_11025 [Mucilaginibacter sp. UR6-1]|uniref:hypothetical protein n=1 Tax=Mucilaginibacter sp. UR6-1 TaxID=1435643 RepID=UPI001E3318B3|nr:hypothetical protein [Mucilaginibacter sp. UR6-1]MCC8409465.1 hypothetical protein [Mucilaginibacter sp. UR6-1]
MKISQLIFLLPFLLSAAFSSCKKYELKPQVEDASYIRVFNNLTFTVDFLNNQQTPPFLTFLMDPELDADGVPNNAGIIGDYLGTRQLYSISYPINAGNSSTGNGTLNESGQPNPPLGYPQNYEYPGNAHVLTAPVINGFDLSSWAQISSGKHRIMFVVRPQSNTPFRDLGSVQRASILVDTTINLEKGEVYTLEVVSRDLDNGKYGLYVRKEEFIHKAFDENKLYAGFINLSGKRPEQSKYGTAFFFPDKVRINSTYNIFNDAASSSAGSYYHPLEGYDNTYYTTLSSKFDQSISYLPLPMLPQSAFFYQGVLRTYSPIVSVANQNTGTMPYISFNMLDADLPVTTPTGFKLNCWSDPAVFNNYTFRNPHTTPNLNLVINSNNQFKVYSTVNIFEMVYNRVYLMQIKRGIDHAPQN